MTDPRAALAEALALKGMRLSQIEAIAAERGVLLVTEEEREQGLQLLRDVLDPPPDNVAYSTADRERIVKDRIRIHLAALSAEVTE